jgi:hypothetical protein
MRRSLVAVPIALAALGCSVLTSLDGLEGKGASDAASDVALVDAAVDASIDAPRDAPAEADVAPPCDLTKPFGTPVAVAGLALDSRSEELVRFSPDLLTAWVLTRTPTINGITSAIVEAKRANASDPFPAGDDLGIPSVALGTTGVQGHFGISSDRLRLVFADASGGLEDCKRGSTSASFVCAPMAVAGAMPFLDPSGKRIWAAVAMPAGPFAPATLDWVSGAWTKPAKITELDLYGSPTAWGHAALTSDAKAIVYEVNDEIFVAHATGGIFGAPVKLGGLGAKSSVTHPSWISDDECTLALVSDRVATTDVFVARRPK